MSVRAAPFYGCGCCGVPVPGPPAIEGRARSASRTKCGHIAYDGSPSYYLNQTATTSGIYTTYAFPGGDCRCDFTQTWSVTETAIFETPYTDCADTKTCLGSVSYSSVCSGEDCGAHLECSGSWNPCTENPPDTGSCFFDTVPASYSIVSGCTGVTATTKTCTFTDNSGAVSTTVSTVWTLENEYTTQMLFDAVWAVMTAWSVWGEAATSFRFLHPTEYSLTLRDAEYRFRWDKAPGTCYLKMWWVERFTPTSGPPVDTNREWEWSPPFNDGTCIPDVDDGKILTPAFALPPPGSNGTVSVTDLRWSFVQGYEPATAESDAQGFPPDPS